MALMVAAVALAVLLSLAPRIGWVDRPDQRKPHQQPVPPVGGVAWLVGMLAGLVCAGPVWDSATVVLIAVVSGMMLVGLLDDLRPLPSILRLLLQLLLAGLLSFFGATQLQQLGQLFGSGEVGLGVLAIPFSVFALVGVTNALNMADGIDGLAGSLALVALLALYWLLDPVLNAVDLRLVLLAAVALVPFLLLNVRLPWQPRARVFFGDAGSMSLGLLLGALLLRGSQGPHAAYSPTVALWLFAVPLVDTVSVMLRRAFAGRSPFRPDQQHAHHLLLRAGLSVIASWSLLVGVALGTALIGVWFALSRTHDSVQACSFLLLGLGYHFWVSGALRSGRLLGRPLATELTRL